MKSVVAKLRDTTRGYAAYPPQLRIMNQFSVGVAEAGYNYYWFIYDELEGRRDRFMEWEKGLL